MLTADDLHLFNEGTHARLYRRLGAHLTTGPDGSPGTHFAVWAPNAESVSVVGDFNGWTRGRNPLERVGASGIWSGLVAGAKRGTIYKYAVDPGHQVRIGEKADPFAFAAEVPPRSGSVVWDLSYNWSDGNWMAGRKRANAPDAPISIYELHLGSWRRPGGPDRMPTYREVAPLVAEHLAAHGFTHVELLPIMEHPFYGSWGYQGTGLFAPTRRYGDPQDLMFFIDTLHQAGFGVILDWVPSHFATDGHGLGLFDGTHLYEHQDPRQGFHPDWGSYIFNYDRHEVRSFLLSSALFWLEHYHVDGLRVDAVASMLYLDYSRKDGEWIPNELGGRENLGAIRFLRQLNDQIGADFPDVITIAEESTAWPGVSRPTGTGGLGFSMKWDMGWMHDTLQFLRKDPVHRRYHHDQLTFRMIYAFHENFVLPLSHDEVVHGKGSLLGAMPGDDWQKFANLRLLFGGMTAQPGKKLLFMGSELAPWREWNHEEGLDWSLLEDARHRGIALWVGDLNRMYRECPELHERDFTPEGFDWIDGSDVDQSVISFLRRGADRERAVAVAANFTPIPRHAYRIGIPTPGVWRVLLNSDAEVYGGSGVGNVEVTAEDIPHHGRPHSLVLDLPPLGMVFLAPA